MAEQVRKSEQTKRRIMDAYARLMRTTAFDKISVKEICSGAGVTRSTFYAYFADLYDLIEQMEEHLLGNMVFFEADGGDTADRPHASVVRWFEYCSANRGWIISLMGDYGEPYFRIRLNKQVTADVERMMEHDKTPRDPVEPYIVDMVVTQHTVLMYRWIREQESGVELLSAERIAAVANRLRAGFLATWNAQEAR